MSDGKNHVPRVVQLDAYELDMEIVRVLKDQLVNIFKFCGSRFLTTWEPELELLLKISMWKFSVTRSYATFGQQLMGIRFGGEYSRRKAWLCAFIMFGTKYLQARSIEISNLSSKRTKKDMMHRMFHYMDMGIQVSSLINFLTFLRNGTYPTLAYRLLGLRNVSIDPGKSRAIGYSYMTRELLWHGFIELLVFTLPLVNYHYIKRKVCRLFVGKEPIECSNSTLDKSSVCSMCGEPPVLPQQIGCPHIYCYYCIRAQVIADPQFECVICGFFPQDSIRPVEM